MKTMLAGLLAAIVPQAVPAFAESPAASPLAGRWAIDVATLPMPPEARPKSVILDFHDAGGGKWSTRIEIVDHDGGKMHAEATLPLDGTPGPVTGNYWADVSAMKMPAPNVLVVQLVDHGTPASTRVYSVTGDGGTLTETKAFFGKDGRPILQTTTFTRVP
ncbi:LuxR family transcriptional regulator [Luteimonas suaedae]|uniref:LuxR family transcriptional regulator n=1 Tax=Luteimonas suaedae TaxID=2605430 RepID=UPI0011EEEB88|nr:LuxR family transcriptional regulator [Luteimonas suaedae]